jgi:hypothetical protein
MRCRFLFIPLLVAASPLPAAAGTMTLGPNFGISVLSNQNANQTIVVWPGDVVGFMPGLRIGFLDRRSSAEFFVDTGLSYESSSGSSSRILQASGNIQFKLSRASTGAFMNAGVGFWSLNEDFGSASTTATVPSLGAGLGVRRVLRHGHGAVRAEMRLDHYFQDQGAGVDAFNSVGLKFGFDLWMR